MQSIKLLLVGESSVGKSSILHRFIDETFNEDQTQTVGVEFGAKVVTLNGKRIKLQIWDSAGQERYRSVTRSYYRGAAGAIIVYDITNRDTYERVPQWLQDVRQLCGPDTNVMLIGNKSDLVVGNSERRQVAHTEASVFAQENHIMHMETSAATGEFVPDAFLKVAKTTLQRLDQKAGGSSSNNSGAAASSSSGGGKRLLQHNSSGAGVSVVDDTDDNMGNSPHHGEGGGGGGRKVRLGQQQNEEDDGAIPPNDNTAGGVCSRC